MILVDVGKENGGESAPKCYGKSMSTSTGLSSEKYSKTNMILMIFEVQVGEVGSKNDSEIVKKTKARWKGILASIFRRFW